MKLLSGLIGYPAKHSLSPWIHERFMAHANIDGSYQIYETQPEDLTDTITGLRNKRLDGFNVTVPFKQEIIPFLDELDEDAERIGAVNTVLNLQGRWKGFNTDGTGYLRSIKNAYPELFSPEKRVLILGAGGAARGIYRALATDVFSNIDIANRTFDKANRLIPLKGQHVTTDSLSFTEAEERLRDYDLIVQTTTVGMNPNAHAQVISLNNMKEDAVVSDIVYQPIETAMLNSAKEKGGKVHYGHGMLLYQAQYAFQKWTGLLVPLEKMHTELEQRLRGF